LFEILIQSAKEKFSNDTVSKFFCLPIGGFGHDMWLMPKLIGYLLDCVDVNKGEGLLEKISLLCADHHVGEISLEKRLGCSIVSVQIGGPSIAELLWYHP
jgi:hypothetical protein